MTVQRGDMAVVAFAAPCCGGKVGCGEIVRVVEPNVTLPKPYEFACKMCGKFSHWAVAEVELTSASGARGLISAQRLVRLPPAGEKATAETKHKEAA